MKLFTNLFEVFLSWFQPKTVEIKKRNFTPHALTKIKVLAGDNVIGVIQSLSIKKTDLILK